MKKENKQELFELLTEDDARSVKERLERARLTQLWLLFRLDRDFGIRIKKAYLSILLDGNRPLTHKTCRIIWCAIKVLDEYEKFYAGR